MHVFYLHGFASSASSSKAAFLAARLREIGIPLHTPDFNQPDFSSLTITRMVEQTRDAIAALPPQPVVLIGSSMGAFVALQTTARQTPDARRQRPIDRLVLLAPAIDFASPAKDLTLGDRTMDEWRASGYTNVFHYGYGRVLPVGYDLYTDACRYDCVNVALDVPIQIFQGTGDTVVDPEIVKTWAAARPNVELHLLDDDHQLGSSLDQIWERTREFIRSTATGS